MPGQGHPVVLPGSASLIAAGHGGFGHAWRSRANAHRASRPRKHMVRLLRPTPATRSWSVFPGSRGRGEVVGGVQIYLFGVPSAPPGRRRTSSEVGLTRAGQRTHRVADRISRLWVPARARWFLFRGRSRPPGGSSPLGWLVGVLVGRRAAGGELGLEPGVLCVPDSSPPGGKTGHGRRRAAELA